MGRPIGSGTFSFPSGLSQTGSYIIKKLPDEEEPAEGEPEKAPNVVWKGNNIVTF
jgi:hypothetical protein